jgi:Multiubiquitin
VANPASQAQDAGAAVRKVEILVNKRPVTVPARTTGAAIKAAADVPADDELFRVVGDHEVKVGDDQVIEVHDGERFVATPPIEPA